MCFICGWDMCVYIHIKKIWKDKELTVMRGYSGKVRLEGREFYFILWLFFIRSIYNFHNAIFLS